MGNTSLVKEKKHRRGLPAQAVDFEQLASSAPLYNHLCSLVGTVCRGMPQAPGLILLAADERAPASHTEGKTISLNPGALLIRGFASDQNRLSTLLGYLFHELAHYLYLDTKQENAALAAVAQGGMPFGAPCCPEGEEAALAELLAALGDSAHAKGFEALYRTLADVISDAHDEDRLCARYGSLVHRSIHTVREGLFANALPLERMAGDEAQSPLAVMLAVIFQHIRFGKVLALRGETLEASPYLEVLARLAPHLDRARAADDVAEKYRQLNAVVLGLWPFIEPALTADGPAAEEAGAGPKGGDASGECDGECEDCDAEEGEEGGSGGDCAGGSEPGDAEMARQVGQAVGSCGGDSFSNPPAGMLRGNFQPGASSREAPPEGQAIPEKPATPKDDTMAKALISQLLDELAGEQAAEELYGEALAKIRSGSMNDTHFGIAVDMRAVRPSQTDREVFQRIVQKNRFFLKRVQREIERVIREENDQLQKRRYIGRGVDAKRAYKVDQRYFTRNKRPEKRLDMAVAILVDNSGSMEGERILAAREAAILLTEVLERLAVPAFVAGHACDSALCFSIYRHFDDTLDAKHAISRMAPGGDNRDGMAIDIACDFLAERPEESKLLIIVSDGQPNSHGYGGELAKKDIQDIVRRRRRAGVKTLAFAIGDDKPQIREIYGEAFIDISDYEAFPRTLSRLIEKELLSTLR